MNNGHAQSPQILLWEQLGLWDAMWAQQSGRLVAQVCEVAKSITPVSHPQAHTRCPRCLAIVSLAEAGPS